MKKLLIATVMSMFATASFAGGACVELGNGEVRCGTVIVE